MLALQGVLFSSGVLGKTRRLLDARKPASQEGAEEQQARSVRAHVVKRIQEHALLDTARTRRRERAGGTAHGSFLKTTIFRVAQRASMDASSVCLWDMQIARSPW